MSLSPKIAEKVKAMQLTSQVALELFTAMASDATIRDVPAATIVALCYEDGDLEPGDWAPEIHFVLRRVE